MKKLIAVLVCVAGAAYGVVGVNSGLTSLFVSGNEIFVTNATTNTVKIFRFLAPSVLTPVGSVTTDKEPISVSVSNPYVYILNRQSKTFQSFLLDFLEGSFNIEILSLIGSGLTGFGPTSGFFRSPYMFVTCGESNVLEVFDTSCNYQPTLVNRVKTAFFPTAVALNGNYALVTCFGARQYGDKSDGLLQIFNVAKVRWGMSLTGWVETDAGPAGVAVASPHAYVVNSIDSTLQSFDISNPFAPKKIGRTETKKNPTGVVVEGNLVFVPCRLDNIVEIFDGSDPARPVSRQRVITDYGPVAIVVRSPYAYVACYRSLQVIDITDPLRKPPMVVASIPID
jgi:hypothetical protein